LRKKKAEDRVGVSRREKKEDEEEEDNNYYYLELIFSIT
jgi:hypothetical protein